MRTKYEIVIAGSVQMLQNCVQQKLDAGWELVGGPFVYNTQAPDVCQAMTRTQTRREVAFESGAVHENSDGSLEFGVPGDQTA
jgi:hypothetical protein